MNELLILKLSVISLCAVCKLISELWYHNAQRFIMPLILCISVSIVSHTWWLGLCVLPMIAPLCMGYSVYGKSDGFDRAVWLMLICLVEGLGLALLHHLSWFVYIPWVILAAVWGGTTRAWINMIIAPFSGAIIGLIILFVH